MTTAKESDLSELLAMVRASPDGPHWPDDAWASLVKDTSRTGHERISLVAREEPSSLAGWLTGTVLGEVAELEFLLVAPGKRRTGLGRALLETWAERVHAAGAVEIFLEVRASNEAALRLYGSKGFIPKGVRRRYYSRPPEDAVVMRLGL